MTVRKVMETGLWRTGGAAGMVDCRPEGSEGGL